MHEYDLLIIGTGSGNSILGPEHDGWDVAIVEEGVFGGTCLNVGCIPSKMLVHAATVARQAADSSYLGLSTRFDGVDWPAVRDRVFGRIDPIASGGEEYRRGLDHVTVVKDRATFVGPRRVAAGGEVVSARHVVVAAGARPSIPEIPGIEEVGFHTSDTIMRIDEVPARLLVIGGGYIAAELGNVFGTFGCDVTFVVRSQSMLMNEDDDVRLRFTELYRHRHTVSCNTQPLAVRRNGAGEVELDVSQNGEHRTIVGDELLVAAGRVPNSDTLNVAVAGIEVDHAGYVVTDEHLRTTAEGVWALGDVTNPLQLKHVANHEARVVAHNLVHPDDLRAVDHRVVPHAVFGDPQVAAVGLTEREIHARQIPYVGHVQPYSSTAYGWAMEDTTSFVKVLAHAETRRLLGAHIVGPQASTLIQQLVQGMVFDQTVDEMAKGQYYLHPALNEVVEQALLEL